MADALDWDDLRCFLAVARHGNLSAAARALDVSQPTVGRRLDAFEEKLGTKLFRRTPEGFVLSTAGEGMLPIVERMELDALEVARVAGGRDVGVEGRVTVSATPWFANRVLGPMFAPLLGRHSVLEIELMTDARRVSLPRREADVAFRFARFEQHEIVARQVARIAFGLYASEAYLAARGMPDFSRGCEGHAIIAMNESVADGPWLSSVAPRARVAIRSNSREVHASCAAAGVGLACLPRLLGDGVLQRVTTKGAPPEREVWLGVHRDTRKTPRVKAVVDFAIDALARMESRLRPGD